MYLLTAIRTNYFRNHKDISYFYVRHPTSFWPCSFSPSSFPKRQLNTPYFRSTKILSASMSLTLPSGLVSRFPFSMQPHLLRPERKYFPLMVLLPFFSSLFRWLLGHSSMLLIQSVNLNNRLQATCLEGWEDEPRLVCFLRTRISAPLITLLTIYNLRDRSIVDSSQRASKPRAIETEDRRYASPVYSPIVSATLDDD